MRLRRGWAVAAGLAVLAGLVLVVLHILDVEATRHAQRVQPRDIGAGQVPAVQALAVPGKVRRVEGERGLVAGTVLLPGGQPAAGATVSLFRASSGWPEWERTRLEQAITGRDGVFRFRSERGPDLLVAFEHPDHAGGLVEASPLVESLSLQLLPGFTLEGVVSNAAGLPLPNAKIALESPLNDRRRAVATTSAANGLFRFTNLPSGVVRLIARHERFAPVVVPVLVVGDRRVVDIRFDRPALSLRGRVVGPGQQPVADAAILAMALNARLGLSEPATATSGPDGSFLLAGLGRGNLRVEVRHPALGTVARTLAVGADGNTVLFELPTRTQLRGHLLEERPALLAEIVGRDLVLRDEFGFTSRARVATDGAFVFPEPVSPGWVTIEDVEGRVAFARTGSSVASVRVRETGLTEVELDLVPPSVVRGRALDERGAPLGGVQVAIAGPELLAEQLREAGSAAMALNLRRFGDQLARLVGFESDRVLAVSDAEGRFEFRGLQSGLLRVGFQRSGRARRASELVVPPAGRVLDGVEIVLPPPCLVRGRALRGNLPVAGALIGVIGAEAQAVVVSDADGRFECADLPPGDYRVRARYGNSAAVMVQAPVRARIDGPPASVTVAFPPGRMLTGTVRGGGGQAVPGAVVLLREGGNTPIVSDAEGRFAIEVPLRPVELLVHHGDRSRAQIVAVPMDRDRIDVQLAIPPSGTLLARVQGLPGRKHLPGGLLKVTRLEGGEEAETTAQWVEMQHGELRLPFHPAGHTRIALCCEGFAPFVTEVELEPAGTRLLPEVLLEPGCRVRGQVLDELGKPVAGAEVFLGEEADGESFLPQLRTAADGTFELSGVTTASAAVVVRQQGFATLEHQLRLPQDVLSARPIELRLQRGGSIEVAVTGALVDDASIVLLRRQGRVVTSAALDERGRALFPNRAAGSYVVELAGKTPRRGVVRLPDGVPGIQVRVE